LNTGSNKRNSRRVTADSEGIDKFRRELHKYPELSGQEKTTSERIVRFMEKSYPDEVLRNLGGHGLAFIFDSGKPGPVVLFRTDMDALPIEEVNTFEHKSVTQGTGHKCGHDGHMAIMSLLSRKIAQQRPAHGRAVLLFQPAEETGEGAAKVIADPQFKKIKPDMAFALHNLPGFGLHEIVLKENTFASASKGMIIKLKGITSHAGEPENGINPALAISKIISGFLALPSEEHFQDFTLITMIHVRLGERAFGTSAGYGEVMATLRSYRNDDMDVLTQRAEEIVKIAAATDKLQWDVTYTEEFPATVNENKCNALVNIAAQEEGLTVTRPKAPFRWSEDFGQFTSRFQAALVGLGSGTKQPQLHNPDYDFPDEITDTGAGVFFNIYKRVLTDNS